MTVLEFSIYPLGKGESVGEHVSRVIDVIDQSGVKYELHSMGTVMEGEWDELFGVVKKCFERMKQDCDRIELVIKVDYRKKSSKGMLEEKVKSVEKRLGRKVKT